MKKLILTLIIILSFMSNSEAGNQMIPSATIRNVYSSTNVTTNAWVQLSAGLPYTISKMYIFDSSGQTLKLGTGLAGHEVPMNIQIPPGGQGDTDAYIVQGTRIVIEAVSANATAGEIDINLFQ